MAAAEEQSNPEEGPRVTSTPSSYVTSTPSSGSRRPRGWRCGRIWRPPFFDIQQPRESRDGVEGGGGGGGGGGSGGVVVMITWKNV